MWIRTRVFETRCRTGNLRSVCRSPFCWVKPSVIFTQKRTICLIKCRPLHVYLTPRRRPGLVCRGSRTRGQANLGRRPWALLVEVKCERQCGRDPRRHGGVERDEETVVEFLTGRHPQGGSEEERIPSSCQRPQTEGRVTTLRRFCMKGETRSQRSSQFTFVTTEDGLDTALILCGLQGWWYRP